MTINLYDTFANPQGCNIIRGALNPKLTSVNLCRINYPHYLRVAHPPELDLAVVRARHHERHVGVERGPVDPAVVPLQDVLDHAVGLPEQVSRPRVAHLR